MSPWEVFNPKPRVPDVSLKGVVSIRKEDIGISKDLADEYFRVGEGYSKILMFVNQETGELGLCPDARGCASRAKSKNACLVFRARRFLHEYPIKPGTHKARWDPDNNLLIIQAWAKPEKSEPEPKVPEPKTPAKASEPEPKPDEPKIDEAPEAIGPLTEIRQDPTKYEKVKQQIDKFQKYSNSVYGNNLVFLREQEAIPWFKEQYANSPLWAPNKLQRMVP